MVASYPSALPVLAKPVATTTEDALDFEHDIVHTRAAEEVEAIATTLGLNPQGPSPDVNARLDEIDNSLLPGGGSADDAVVQAVAGVYGWRRLLRWFGDVVTLPDSAQQFLRIDIPDDLSATNTWPDRLVFFFNGARTGYFNEYGEHRARPAKQSTVGFRSMAHPTAAADQEYFQVAETSSSEAALGVNKSQVIARLPLVAPNVRVPSVALPVGAALPADLPDPVLIFRY